MNTKGRAESSEVNRLQPTLKRVHRNYLLKAIVTSKVAFINDHCFKMFQYKKHINMQHLREKMGILSVNQLACYHILLETFNILNKNSSPQIEHKIKPKSNNYIHTRSSERKDLNVINKPKKNCIGFTYISAKLWNMLPVQIRDLKSPDPFKAAIKSWIPSNIPD